MKKFLTMAVIVMSVFILQIPQVAAYDYFVGTYSSGYKAYLMTETIRLQSRDRMDYTCRVKALYGNDVIYVDYTFWEDRQRTIVEHFKNSQDYSGMFTITDPNGFYIEHKIDEYVGDHYYE